jgi:uncharacterized protein (DUF2249 family)
MANSTLESPSTRTRLDLRGLTSPETMQRVFEGLARLPSGATLVFQADREPLLLYEMVEADGWSRSARRLASNHWELCICRPEDVF